MVKLGRNIPLFLVLLYRFNEVSAEVYKDYTTFLAYDLAQTKQKHVSKYLPIMLKLCINIIP